MVVKILGVLFVCLTFALGAQQSSSDKIHAQQQKLLELLPKAQNHSFKSPTLDGLKDFYRSNPLELQWSEEMSDALSVWWAYRDNSQMTNELQEKGFKANYAAIYAVIQKLGFSEENIEANVKVEKINWGIAPAVRAHDSCCKLSTCGGMCVFACTPWLGIYLSGGSACVLCLTATRAYVKRQKLLRELAAMPLRAPKMKRE